LPRDHFGQFLSRREAAYDGLENSSDDIFGYDKTKNLNSDILRMHFSQILAGAE
jgi:hypothetical protein